MLSLRITIGLIMLVALPCRAASELDLGVGVFGISTPHYLGSAQSQRLVVPMPYINYRSDRLEINRDRLSGLLWQRGPWYVDISLAASLAVDSKDNKARENMPDLGWIFELGPSLDYYLVGAPRDKHSLKLGMYTRKALSTDFSSIDDIGWRYGPNIKYKHQFSLLKNEKLDLSVRLNMNFATKHYHEHFYGVEPPYTNHLRNEYKASSGYVGSDLSLGLSYNTTTFWYGGFLKYSLLHGSKNENSPLFRKKKNLALGIGFAWKFITLRN